MIGLFVTLCFASQLSGEPIWLCQSGQIASMTTVEECGREAPDLIKHWLDEARSTLDLEAGKEGTEWKMLPERCGPSEGKEGDDL